MLLLWLLPGFCRLMDWGIQPWTSNMSIMINSSSGLALPWGRYRGATGRDTCLPAPPPASEPSSPARSLPSLSCVGAAWLGDWYLWKVWKSHLQQRWRRRVWSNAERFVQVLSRLWKQRLWGNDDDNTGLLMGACYDLVNIWLTLWVGLRHGQVFQSLALQRDPCGAERRQHVPDNKILMFLSTPVCQSALPSAI